MPLSKQDIIPEERLANAELYQSARRDDPSAILQGVAVASFVGIVRQLGELSEYASGVFESLQQDVEATVARRNLLSVRIRDLEQRHPSMEQMVLKNTNSLQFVDNSGLQWKAPTATKENFFTQSDPFPFVLEVYNDIRHPPPLYLLDRFDRQSEGKFMVAYSDPAFFKREWVRLEASKASLKAKRDKRLKRGVPASKDGLYTIQSIPFHMQEHMEVSAPGEGPSQPRRSISSPDQPDMAADDSALEAGKGTKSLDSIAGKRMHNLLNGVTPNGASAPPEGLPPKSDAVARLSVRKSKSAQHKASELDSKSSASRSPMRPGGSPGQEGKKAGALMVTGGAEGSASEKQAAAMNKYANLIWSPVPPRKQEEEEVTSAASFPIGYSGEINGRGQGRNVKNGMQQQHSSLPGAAEAADSGQAPEGSPQDMASAIFNYMHLEDFVESVSEQAGAAEELEQVSALLGASSQLDDVDIYLLGRKDREVDEIWPPSPYESPQHSHPSSPQFTAPATSARSLFAAGSASPYRKFAPSPSRRLLQSPDHTLGWTHRRRSIATVRTAGSAAIAVEGPSESMEVSLAKPRALPEFPRASSPKLLSSASSLYVKLPGSSRRSIAFSVDHSVTKWGKAEDVTVVQGGSSSTPSLGPGPAAAPAPSAPAAAAAAAASPLETGIPSAGPDPSMDASTRAVAPTVPAAAGAGEQKSALPLKSSAAESVEEERVSGGMSHPPKSKKGGLSRRKAAQPPPAAAPAAAPAASNFAGLVIDDFEQGPPAAAPQQQGTQSNTGWQTETELFSANPASLAGCASPPQPGASTPNTVPLPAVPQDAAAALVETGDEEEGPRFVISMSESSPVQTLPDSLSPQPPEGPADVLSVPPKTRLRARSASASHIKYTPPEQGPRFRAAFLASFQPVSSAATSEGSHGKQTPSQHMSPPLALLPESAPDSLDPKPLKAPAGGLFARSKARAELSSMSPLIAAAQSRASAASSLISFSDNTWVSKSDSAASTPQMSRVNSFTRPRKVAVASAPSASNFFSVDGGSPGSTVSLSPRVHSSVHGESGGEKEKVVSVTDYWSAIATTEDCASLPPPPPPSHLPSGDTANHGKDGSPPGSLSHDHSWEGRGLVPETSGVPCGGLEVVKESGGVEA